MTFKKTIIEIIGIILIGFPIARILYIIYDKDITRILMLASLYSGIELLILTFGRKE